MGRVFGLLLEIVDSFKFFGVPRGGETVGLHRPFTPISTPDKSRRKPESVKSIFPRRELQLVVV